MACFARAHERRRGQLDCVALSKQLKINTAARYTVRAEHYYSLPDTYTYTHTHSHIIRKLQRLLQLVTNIADHSYEKLIKFSCARNSMHSNFFSINTSHPNIQYHLYEIVSGIKPPTCKVRKWLTNEFNNLPMEQPSFAIKNSLDSISHIKK